MTKLQTQKLKQEPLDKILRGYCKTIRLKQYLNYRGVIFVKIMD